MSETRVIHAEDGDTGTFRWGTEGRAHSFEVGDDAGYMRAYKNALAEGIANGDPITDDLDRDIARELQKSIGIFTGGVDFAPRSEMEGLAFDWTTAPEDPRRLRKDAKDSTIVGWFPGEEICTQLTDIMGGGYSPSMAQTNTGYPMHLTMLFISDPDVDGTTIDLQLIAAITKLYTRWREPLKGTISGVGRFVGPEDTDVVVALVDIPGLDSLRDCLKSELQCQGAIPYDSPLYNERHGFVPHITLAYVPKGQGNPQPLAETIPINLDSLTVSCGSDNQITFALGYPGNSPEQAVEGQYDPYFAARDAVALQKAGRVLSGKNMKALKEAIDVLQNVHDSAQSPEATDEAKATDTKKRREFLAAVAGSGEQEYAIQYLVTKATEESRYTFGPLYAPMRQDAHGEYTAGDTLQKAMWDFVQSKFDAGDNRLNLQHGDLGEIQVANMVEVATWPIDHTITVTKADGTTTDLDMPAGTSYIGAIWDEDAWPLIKSGKLNGWSLGGKAIRVSGAEADMPHMGYKVAAATKAVAPVLETAAEPSADDLALLEAAHKQDVALARAEAEGATLKAEGGRISDMFGQVMDMLKGRREPDLHVHLPDQSVTVHEGKAADVNVTVEKADAAPVPVVNVNFPDEIKTVPAETETVAERGKDGLVHRSVTRPTGG